jgi:hypothetical protein
MPPLRAVPPGAAPLCSAEAEKMDDRPPEPGLADAKDDDDDVDDR